MPFRCVPAILLLPLLSSFGAADEIPDFPAELVAAFEAEIAGVLAAGVCRLLRKISRRLHSWQWHGCSSGVRLGHPVYCFGTQSGACIVVAKCRGQSSFASDLCVTRCPCPPGPRTRCEASFSGCAGPVAGSRCCAGQYATNSMRNTRCFRHLGSWSHQSSPRVRDAVGLLSRRTFAPSQGSFLPRSRFISKVPCRVFL